MTSDQAKIGFDEERELKERHASDSTEMSDGVGGNAGLEDDERATVGDVDGDNVRDGETIKP